MFRMNKKTKVALVGIGVLLLGLLAVQAFSQSFPTWKENDMAAGGVPFYDTVPWDQNSTGPGIVQITAHADTVRVSFHYYSGSAWVKMNGKVAYGDTNMLVLPGETAVFRFTYPHPDLAYITTDGTCRLWAE